MENQALFQVVVTEYLNGGTMIKDILGHNKDMRECKKMMKNMYKNMGYIKRKYSNCIQYFSDITEHWDIEVRIVCSTVNIKDQPNFFFTEQEVKEMRNK